MKRRFQFFSRDNIAKPAYWYHVGSKSDNLKVWSVA